MRVGFRNFFDGFDPYDFFVPLLVSSTDLTWSVASKNNADLIVESVFVSRLQRFRKRVLEGALLQPKPEQLSQDNNSATKIWYTGENVRAPVHGYNASISFDIDTYGGSNHYFPLIVKELDWSAELGLSDGAIATSRRGTTRPRPADVATERATYTSDRPKFACAFIGNPHPIRLRAVESLRAIGEVDVFGSAVGRPVADKQGISQAYRFMVCFENDLYPGYVTEKLLDSYAAHCVPLWWGNDAARFLNRGSFVNAADFESLAAFVDRVQQLDASPAMRQEMLRQPLFAQRPTLESLSEFIRRVLNV